MATYKFSSSTNRVTMQQDNGQTHTPGVNDIGTGSIGNMVYVDIRNVRVFTIDVTVDFIALTTNNTTVTKGPAQSPYANGAAAEAAIVALFPNANTGSGGSGSVNQNGSTYFMLSQDEYNQVKAAIFDNNIPSGT